MAEQAQPTSFDLAEDQPLIGIPLEENGRHIVRYFTDEVAVDPALASRRRGIRQLAGLWARLDPDLDWEILADELDRLRHESTPTPPIELGG